IANLIMVPNVLAGPEERKNVGKSPSNDVELVSTAGSSSYSNRINNTNNLAPPKGNLSKSQPKPSFQNKLGSSPVSNPFVSGRLSSSYSGPESAVINIPKERKVEIVRKHLVTGEDLARSYENNGISPEPHYFGSASHNLLGGDATHE
ncbi:13703_t:CDS:1, partial [Acaulospora morrowiae]